MARNIEQQMAKITVRDLRWKNTISLTGGSARMNA